MRPLRNWLAVERQTILPSSILYLPTADLRESLVGKVVAVGEGVLHKGKLRSLDLKPGDRIVYSSRIDKYRVKDDQYDVIEEGSVIGFV